MRDTELQRWLNTWIALGAVVLVVTAGYLFFISNALVSIHRDLASTGDAVASAEGNTKTLPGQLTTLNQTLAALEVALRATPDNTTAVEQGRSRWTRTWRRPSSRCGRPRGTSAP